MNSEREASGEKCELNAASLCGLFDLSERLGVQRNDSGTPKKCQNSSNGVCPLISSRPFQTFFFPAPLFHFHLCLLDFPLHSGAILGRPAAFDLWALTADVPRDECAAVEASGVAPSGRTVVGQGSPVMRLVKEGSARSWDLVRTRESSGPRPQRRPIKDTEETNTRHFCLSLRALPLLRDGDKTRR